MSRVLDQFVEATKDIQMIGAIVYQDGEVRDRYMWEAEYRINQYSVSKSYVATLAGLAIDEGLIALDAPIKPYLTEAWPSKGQVSEETMHYLDQVTLYHLLTMTLGQAKADMMSGQRLRLKSRDWVQHILSKPIVDRPGTKFVYNNGAIYLASVVLSKAVGMSLVDYLMPRLFEPMNMYRPTWETDPQGRDFGASGLSLSVSEIAKFGQLYLQEGVWEGNRLISKEWVELARKAHINSNPRLKGSSDYGIGFWLGKYNSYRADGKYGQMSLVLPDKKAVVAVNAFNRSSESLLDYVWKDLYPYL